MKPMTPEQHYAQARDLIDIASERHVFVHGPQNFESRLEVLALAQVHATLSLYRPERDQQ